MKYILIALTAVAAAVQAGDIKQKAHQIDEEYKEIRKTCANKLDLTSEQVTAMEMIQTPTELTEKCWLECVLTQSKIMNGGRFSREKADEISAWIYEDDSDSLANAKEATKRCEKEVEAAKLDDPCEVAAEIYNCFRRLSKSYEVKKLGDFYD